MSTRIKSITSHLLLNKTLSDKSAERIVLYEVLENGIALITLNRPGRMNALTPQMQSDYLDALDRAAADNNIKVIVVTGAGKAFSAGADMEILGKIGSEEAVDFKFQQPGMRDLAQVQALRIPKPIIAAINGPVAGLGFVLATMADIRFATKEAKFTTAFSKRGLVAEYGVSFTLPKIVGLGNAMDLLLSSKVIQGDEAMRIGLVQGVFADQQSLMKGVLAYGKEMAIWCSPASFAAMKHQVYNDCIRHFDDVQKSAAVYMDKSLQHPDSEEGVQSYLKKKVPVFQGLKAGELTK